MAVPPGYPTDHDPTAEIRPALGRFEDVATVVGPRRPGCQACWCMAYRDGRVPAEESPTFMQQNSRTIPLRSKTASPGRHSYVGTVWLFEAAGFERAAPTTARSGGRPRWVMRTDLR